MDVGCQHLATGDTGSRAGEGAEAGESSVYHLRTFRRGGCSRLGGNPVPHYEMILGGGHA
jgi:hypothetical protein